MQRILIVCYLIQNNIKKNHIDSWKFVIFQQVFNYIFDTMKNYKKKRIRRDME